jgi:hypothetical protein
MANNRMNFTPDRRRNRNSLENGLNGLQDLGHFSNGLRSGQPVAELAVDRLAGVDSGVGLELLHLLQDGGG